MENASKALIIAGAILLAILLISLGIFIFSMGQDTVNNSGMSQAEVTAFNNKFLKYEGTQKGSVVKSLINEVKASNADDNNSSAKRVITLTGILNSYEIDTTKSYIVKMSDYGGPNGTISEINISEKE